MHQNKNIQNSTKNKGWNIPPSEKTTDSELTESNHKIITDLQRIKQREEYSNSLNALEKCTTKAYKTKGCHIPPLK